MKTPESILRRKAQLLYQKEQQLKKLNPFADGDLRLSEEYVREVEQLQEEIARLRTELNSANMALCAPYMDFDHKTATDVRGGSARHATRPTH